MILTMRDYKIIRRVYIKMAAMKLYVGGLAYSVTEKELEELFAEQGTVVSVAIIKDRDTGQSKGFGFVEMAEVKDGQNAIKELNGKDLGGREIMVNEARPKEDRNSGGSFRKSY
jgi:RNA recognition motif-containing protein